MDAVQSPPDLGLLASRLRMVNARLHRRLRHEAQGELSASAMAALSTIATRGPIGLGDLAEAEQVRPPTITAVAAGLEAAGLVSREAGRDDRRRAYLSVTDRGRRLVERSRTRKTAYLARKLGELPAADLAALAAATRVLERLLESGD